MAISCATQTQDISQSRGQPSAVDDCAAPILFWGTHPALVLFIIELVSTDHPLHPALTGQQQIDSMSPIQRRKAVQS